jgi:hypothetical protein
MPGFMPPVVPVSGRAGRVQVLGANWQFDDCNVVFSTTTGTTTGFEDQNPITGRTPENRSDGNDDFKGSISGPLNAIQMPSTVFVQGAILKNLFIWLDKNVAPRFCGSTRVIVRQVTYHPKQSDPAQRVTIEFENAGGDITHPT